MSPPRLAVDPLVERHSGLQALTDTLGLDVDLSIGRVPNAIRPATVAVVVGIEGAVPAHEWAPVAAHLAAGGRTILAIDATPLATLHTALEELRPGLVPFVAPRARTLAAPDPDEPLVFRTRLDAEAVAPELAGMRMAAAGWAPLEPTVGQPLFEVAGHPTACQLEVGAGRLTVLGDAFLAANEWLAALDNAAVVAWAITGRLDRTGPKAIVGAHQPSLPGDPHAIPVIDAEDDDSVLGLLPRDVDVSSDEFVLAAGRAARLLHPAVHDALVEFVDRGNPSGALLLRRLPVGHVPPTPPTPTSPSGKDHTSEFVLLTVARRLGQPVGYAPEHGGDIVQNLVPVSTSAERQVSTSSAVQLEFHTETAFHPHKPRFLLLLCLRGDPAALTLLSSIADVVDRLPLGVRQTLTEPRFRTGVDESFTGSRSDRLGRPVPILAGDPERPTFHFDADLMRGIDDEAQAALETLRRTVGARHQGIALTEGDLLVVDNAVAVHGRSPFRARFDGTDRWLQRSFVVMDLSASAGERVGRVLTTRFS